MKTVWIVVIVLVLVLLLCYFTNWFGLKKSNNLNVNQKNINSFVRNMISCPSGCTLSSNLTGASGTATSGNNTYTCRCSDGSTTTPIIN